MSINPLNDISRVYLEQVASFDEGIRPTPVNKPLNRKEYEKRRKNLAGSEERDAARARGHEGKEWHNTGRTYSPDEAKSRRSGMSDYERRQRYQTAEDPDNDNADDYPASKTKNPKKLRKQRAMGEIGEAKETPKRWWDDDGDGVGYEEGEVSGKFKRKRKVTKEAKETPKRWWDDDGDGVGYEEGEVSGKFKRKKKLKESFSNWRGDLFEILDTIDNQEEQPPIEEKRVKNKIKINPTFNEAVENLGGTLLEMVEVDEFDYIVESVYDELLDEGYNEDDIEEALEFALTEAKITFGHDTPTMEKKERVSNTARKAIDGKYRNLGVGRVERVSSGSYVPPTKKKTTEKPADPWEGSETTPPKAKKKRPAAKPKTTKISGGTAKPPAKRKRTSKLDDLLADIRKESLNIGEQSFDINPVGHRQQQRIEKATKLQQATKGAESSAAGSGVRRLGGSGVSLPLANSYEPEGTQIDEKTLTAAETEERERIVKSMKDKAADFEKRYPGRGKEVMYATATKMAKKITEQQLDEFFGLFGPRTVVPQGGQLSGSKAPVQVGKTYLATKNDELQKVTYDSQGKRSMTPYFPSSTPTSKPPTQQPTPRSTPSAPAARPGTIDANLRARRAREAELMKQSYEPEGEVLDERRRSEKGTPRKPRDPAFEYVAKMMGSSRLGVQPRGKKKEPGKKPPAAGEYGAPASPAQKVAKRRADAQRAQELMHSRFD